MLETDNRFTVYADTEEQALEELLDVTYLEELELRLVSVSPTPFILGKSGKYSFTFVVGPDQAPQYTMGEVNNDDDDDGCGDDSCPFCCDCDDDDEEEYEVVFVSNYCI